MKKDSELKQGELELINKYTRRSYSEDEIYVFSLVLCDNEIDRDNERFSEDALKKLEKLFVGVTGITDHDPKTENQTARIFSCRTETIEDRLTSDGKPYVQLKARAYIPRADSSELINLIDSGIKKEVSVGCSVSRRICSVCGKSISVCGHIKGRYYDGRFCYAALEDPTDAYEWSFVAVPAQRAAGVTKAFDKGGEYMDIEKRIFSGGSQSFTAEEMNVLAEKFRSLGEKAADGETYRKRLIEDINKAAAFALPELRRDTLGFITGKMNAVQLEELCKALTKKASEHMPLRPQLAGMTPAKRNNNNEFTNI